MKNTLIIALLSLFALPTYAGGGWPQAKGAGYLKLAEWWISSDQHFTSTGQIDPNVTSGIYNTSLYGEYGLTDRLTVAAYIPFFSRATVNNVVSQTTGEVLIPGDAINSFGDTDLSLSYGLTRGKWNSTLTLTFGIPLGIDNGGSQMNLQTGDGEFNQMIRYDLGTGLNLGGLNGYTSAYVALNNRTEGFSDEFRFGVEGGVHLFNKKVLAIMRVYGVFSFKNGILNSEATGTSIFANDAEHVSFTPEINYNIGKNWGISAAVGGAFYGRLIFARPSYSFGVYTTF